MTLHRKVPGSIPRRESNFFCHCMLDGYSRITSLVARSRGIRYVMINAPSGLSDTKQVAKSDGQMLKIKQMYICIFIGYRQRGFSIHIFILIG